MNPSLGRLDLFNRFFLIKNFCLLYHIVEIVLQISDQGYLLNCIFLDKLDDLELNLRGLLMDYFLVFLYFLDQFLPLLFKSFIFLPHFLFCYFLLF